MKLLSNFLYRGVVENVSFGRVPPTLLRQMLGNGRQCGIMLEAEISTYFDDCVLPPTQGANADIISEDLGDVQAKTWHWLEEEFYKTGPRKGQSKYHSKDIWTSKSGLWDSSKRRKELGEDVPAMIAAYFDQYDHFMYIDISKMKIDYSYSFITLPTSYVKSVAVDGKIAPIDIISQVKDEIILK